MLPTGPAPFEQKHEKILSPKNVGKLQLVIKRKLGNEPLSAPVMLGGLVTNRGIKDLVFISGGGMTYAVDSDLGTLFWQRPVAGTPILEPRGADSDDEDYLSTEVRQLYLRQPDGKIITLNAGSGRRLRRRGRYQRAGAIKSTRRSRMECALSWSTLTRSRFCGLSRMHESRTFQQRQPN